MMLSSLSFLSPNFFVTSPTSVGPIELIERKRTKSTIAAAIRPSTISTVVEESVVLNAPLDKVRPEMSRL